MSLVEIRHSQECLNLFFGESVIWRVILTRVIRGHFLLWYLSAYLQ